MPTMVGVEGNDGSKGSESAFEKCSSASQSPKQSEVSRLYKLVRIQDDGRLVPVTDDELVEVAKFLENKEMEMCHDENSGQPIECISNNHSLSEGILTESSKGLLQAGHTELDADKLNARLENVEEMLQMVNKKEMLPIACGSPDHSCASMKVDCQSFAHDKLSGNDEKLNSFNVSATTFIFGNKKLATKEQNSICVHAKPKVPVIGTINSCSDLPISRIGITEDHTGCSSDDLQCEEKPAKRVRKPTLRYIEENSKVESTECNAKLISSDNTLTNTQVTFVNNNFSDRRGSVAQIDSLEGSRVQIPCVSRVRRKRSREKVLSLMKYEDHGASIAAEQADINDVHNSQHDNETVEDKSFQKNSKPLVVAEVNDLHYPATDMVVLEAPKVEPEHVDSLKDASNDNIETVPTAKGGIRRKYHRAWTLSEVVKLVEGVYKHGLGKWSEIKRISFASCSHRTSVDLKDKWRNMLKASSPSDNEIVSRKPGSAPPIPASILLRVRELAKQHAQASPNLG